MRKPSYDILIIGGGIMGASAAWFLSQHAGFAGRVAVIERDPTYATASTTHTNSCMRQQFSTDLNIRISQYAAHYVTSLRHQLGGDIRVPELSIHNFGYLYLADTPALAQTLRDNQRVQQAAGAATRLLSRDDIRAAYPFYNVDDILLGSINRVDEGYFDGATLFDWWRRKSREAGVAYLHGTVAGLTRQAARITGVTLADGSHIACGQVLNAAGPRAAQVAAMAGIDLPVEPRKRFSWVFRAQHPLDRDLPLTIDPSGVHVREIGGGTYLAGGHADPDPAVAQDDFTMHETLWLDHVWPVLANRIPPFEAIKVTREWAGHYAYNTLDQNAILGPHPDLGNLYFINGFSGHGLQQSPAMGRGIAEIMVTGGYETLDLTPFHYDRIAVGQPIREKAII